MEKEQLLLALDRVPPDVLAGVIEHIQELELSKTDHTIRLKLALSNVKMYYEQILPQMLASDEPRVQEIVDILVDSCLVEKNFEEALLYFAEQVHARGFEIEIEPEKFRGWVEKLSNIRLYRKVIHAMGLGAFEEELMRVEIEKTMAPRLPAPTPSPKNRKPE